MARAPWDAAAFNIVNAMSLLSALFAPRADPLQHCAETLVTMSNAVGVSGYVPIAKEYPAVYDVETEHWDWVFTVACVFVAASKLGALPISASRKRHLGEVLSTTFGAWKSDALRGFADCEKLFNSTCARMQEMNYYKQNPEFIATDGLGRWMFWNLFKHAPSETSEIELSRLLGTACIGVDWWT